MLVQMSVWECHLFNGVGKATQSSVRRVQISGNSTVSSILRK